MGEFNKLLKEKIETKKSPLERLKTFITIHLKTLSTNRELAEIFTIELRQSAKFMADYNNSELKDYAKLLIEILDLGKKENIFKDEIPTNIIWQFIFGILDQIVLTWVRKESSTEKNLQNMIKFVLLFILDSILIKED
jgi:TetR/AcrR family fatty acid metabolism transcriptional regulator